MNAFIVDLTNSPGELARMTEAIGDKGIDILGLSGATCGDTATVTLITNDDVGTRRALATGRWIYRPVELVSVAVPNTPGSLSKVARRLGDAGVNIETIIPTGMSGGSIHLAFATDSPTKAKETLIELMPVAATRS